jgi:hypothetical protein
MDVKSVSTPAVRPAPRHTEEAHKPPVHQNKPPEHDSTKAAQTAPKPVVNTQGQQTGRYLNVSA